MKENSQLKFQISFMEHGKIVGAYITGPGLYQQALGSTAAQALGLLLAQISPNLKDMNIDSFEIVCNKKPDTVLDKKTDTKSDKKPTPKKGT